MTYSWVHSYNERDPLENGEQADDYNGLKIPIPRAGSDDTGGLSESVHDQRRIPSTLYVALGDYENFRSDVVYVFI